MATYFWIGIGSAVGGMARYWCNGLVTARLGHGFPWGILFVNMAGSFIIGFFATISGPEGRLMVGDNARLFVMAGLCGGFTTFSAFSLQTLELARSGNWLGAGANVTASVVLCLAFAAIGHAAATALGQIRG